MNAQLITFWILHQENALVQIQLINPLATMLILNKEFLQNAQKPWKIAINVMIMKHVQAVWI